MDFLGTDIDDSWSFTDGDINLVSGEFNLQQAIVNRLKCPYDFYQEFYPVYGGNLMDEMGELNNSSAHEYLRIEIESILQQEPRIKELTCTVNKTDSNTVEVNLKIRTIDNDEFVELNLVISKDTGVYISQNNGMMEKI